MPSGIFLLGRDLKDYETFEEYIEPNLVSQGIQVPDRTIIPEGDRSPRSLLISLAGMGDLEKALQVAISRGFKETKERYGYGKGRENLLEKHGFTIVRPIFNESHKRENDSEENTFEEFNDIAKKSIKYRILIHYQNVGGIYADITAASQLFPSVALPYFVDYASKKVEELRKNLAELTKTTLADFAKA